jgi:endonuclease/exonuclease/phosphatase (EEP) superfamily protein YafD
MPAAPMPAGGPTPVRHRTTGRRLLRWVGLEVAAIGLLLWSLAVLVGDVRWGPLSVVVVVAAAASPLALLPAIPVCVAAVRRRRWAAVVPGVVAAGLPWVFTIPYIVPAEAPATSPPPASLRVMLVSADDGHADPVQVAASTRTRRADLVVVLGLTPQLTHDFAVAGLGTTLVPRYVSVPPAGAPVEGGLAIYSRFDVDGIELLGAPARPVVRARVHVGDRTVTLVAAHTRSPSTTHLDAWRSDLRAVGAAAAVDGPVLVLGDLGATVWNPQFRRLTSGRLHDAADVLGHGLRPTWPSWSPLPLLPLDHALVAGIDVVSIDTVDLTGTDQRGLALELGVPAA